MNLVHNFWQERVQKYFERVKKHFRKTLDQGVKPNLDRAN